jgi:hypothetical protein
MPRPKLLLLAALMLPLLFGASELTTSPIFPLEGKALNYRIIGFSFPSSDDANTRYKLEIASGYYNSEQLFAQNVCCSRQSDSNAIIAEVPLFGRKYTWRVTYFTNDIPVKKSALNHFSTLSAPCVDTSVVRLRIIQQAKKYQDGYIFVDGRGTLYDLNGNPVWFLPDINKTFDDNSTVRDLKLNRDGSLTFLSQGIDNHDEAFDINYYGDVIWTSNKGATNGENTGQFHHQLTKLVNGHYMALGLELMNCRIKPKGDDSDIIAASPLPEGADLLYSKIPFGTVVEYDGNKKIVWSWRSSDYFKHAGLACLRNQNGGGMNDPHENGFFFDEKNKHIYLSIKNISTILKISYPDGKLLNAYGSADEPSKPRTVEEIAKEAGNASFCHQHSCILTEDGHLCLFNNNICRQGELPSVIVMKEQPAAGRLQKIWEYSCGVKDLAGPPDNHIYGSGGSVAELKDNDLLVNMGLGKVFIVNRNKEILWSAVGERRSDSRWDYARQYKASFVSRADLEKAILKPMENTIKRAHENEKMLITYNTSGTGNPGTMPGNIYTR